MNLHLTPAEWDRIAADGEGVLIRPGVRPCSSSCSCGGLKEYPLAEFVEAAAPCETCDPRAWVPRKPDLPCGDCLDGKRRIAVVVPCDEPGCPHVGPCNRGRDGRGYLTVGYVVVTFGPLVVSDIDADCPNDDHLFIDPHRIRGHLHRCTHGDVNENKWDLPPDIDPQSLVGHWALGVEVVEP